MHNVHTRACLQFKELKSDVTLPRAFVEVEARVYCTTRDKPKNYKDIEK